MRQLNPHDKGKIYHRDLPFIKGNKVLLSDPALIKRLEHIAKPYRGSETLEYNVDEPYPGEAVYVDFEMFALIMLNEVSHLRQQIGVLAEGAYRATAGNFDVRLTPPFVTPYGVVEDETVTLGNFVVKR